MRIVYVTSRFPFDSEETFLLPEVQALRARGHDLRVIPMHAAGGVPHDDVQPLLPVTLAETVLSPRVVAAALAESAARPRAVAAGLRHAGGGRTARIRAKNLAVAPKALWLARTLRALGAEHVHAHWGGASSTMAMLGAELAGVPWSMTLHRWDIAEDNLLACKLASATFVRTISEHGAREVAELVPGATVEVVHMGVDVPPSADVAARSLGAEPGPLRLLAVGSLLSVKGHAVLLEAMALAAAAAPEAAGVSLEIAGAGALREQLGAQASSLGLAGRVRFLGLVPHARLLAEMREDRWDVLVQPSLHTSLVHEGIPVALMEAMGAGLPVIATASGGSGELIEPAAGMLVPPGDPRRLAEAIVALARDRGLAARLGRAGHERVRADFNVAVVAGILEERFAGMPAEGRRAA